MKKFQLLHILIISLSVFLISLLISSLGALKSLELKTIDWRFSFRGPLSVENSPIVIVTIDDQSFNVLPDRWPWPRSYYGRVIKNLTKAGAAVIGLDVILDIPDVQNPANDSMLAATIRETDNVVLTGKIEQSRRLQTYYYKVEPIPLLLDASDNSWGLGSIQIDEDGFYRRYIIGQEHGGELLPSFALAVLKKYNYYGPEVSLNKTDTGFQFGDYNISTYDASTMLINFAGPEGTFPSYSFESVIDDSTFFLGEEEDLDYFEELMSDSVFMDKIVLIGSTVAELHDNFPTPFLGYKGQPKEMPGVEVHANAINTILNNHYLTQPNYLIYLLIVLLLVFLVQFLSLRFSTVLSSILTVVIILLYIGAQFLIFSKFFLVMGIVLPTIAIFLSYVSNNIYQYILTQKEKQMIMGAFERYVPQKVVKELLDHPEKLTLGGEERFMTVLFSDIADFTSISETMTPPELVHLINEYLTEMTEVILDHDGIIDKYVGDAIMAEFGAPVFYEEHALNACLAALHMQSKLAELSKKLEKEKKPILKSRIGINTGNMVVGNMGSNKVFNYTVMGDEVNLASRLEGANKIFSTYIMISENTYNAVKDKLDTRPLDMLRVKGKEKPVNVFELLGKKTDVGYFRDSLATYINGIRYYHDRRWEQSAECFKYCLKLHPEDGPSKLYLRRVLEYSKNPPPPDWDGVFKMTSK